MVKTVLLQPKEKSFSYAEQELYWNYKNELWEISKDPHYSIEAVKTWYQSWLQSPGYTIRIFVDGVQRGFVFIGIDENCHEECDYYIQDCYLDPKYRNQFLMTNAVKFFIENHPGKFCLFLIDSNFKAIRFWESVFNFFRYYEVSIEDYSGMETYNCHLHAFEHV